jgi:hypothetical protein
MKVRRLKDGVIAFEPETQDETSQLERLRQGGWDEAFLKAVEPAVESKISLTALVQSRLADEVDR